MTTLQDTQPASAGANGQSSPEAQKPEERGSRVQGAGASVYDTPQRESAQATDETAGVGTKLRDTAQELVAQAQALGTKAEEALQEAVAEYYAQGREGLDDLQQTIESQIRDKPLQALLVAGGVGILLAVLWRRS